MMNHAGAFEFGEISNRIRELAVNMGQNSAEDHVTKFEQLLGKLADGKLAIAFCGHFSAGKSTLVNRICGTTILPSSPIPTSANVVTIANGEPLARISKEHNGQIVPIEVPLEQLENHCRDGATVHAIELFYPIPLLGNHISILDTPGIDSTDDAHRMATESALHIADVVFYVMDYNHVMSEINFTFAKQLQDWGKPLYLIVNQIDKHREQELSFTQYQKSVEEGFANWHLQPADIIYLSLRQPDHPYSQFSKLEQLFDQLLPIRSQLVARSVYDSAVHLVQRHLAEKDQQQAETMEQLTEQAGGAEQIAQLEQTIRQFQDEIALIERQQANYREHLLQDVQKLLDNANVTPAVTRDLAHQFLQSQQPGFKKGMLFAGAKTEAEKERRLQQFQASFVERVIATIEWHLKDIIRKEAGQTWTTAQLEQQMTASLQCELRADWFIKQIRQGASFGNEYTLNYCRDIAAEIKSVYRKKMLDWIDQLDQLQTQRSQLTIANIKEQLAAFLTQSSALTALQSLQNERKSYEQQLKSLLPEAPQLPHLPQVYVHEQVQVVATNKDSETLQPLATVIESTQMPAVTAETSQARAPQRATATKLVQASQLLSAYDALTNTVHAMQERANRLTNSEFTVALFGAFSAGKSSLANALLGESVLPVSPNPTTATVNKIVAPFESFTHNTASVKMKSRAELFADVRYSLALLGEQVDSLRDDQLIRIIELLAPSQILAGGRPHYSFLKAVVKGWKEHEPLLGTDIHVDQATYRQYVAEESRSCFVQEITLYHHNSLTMQGIVLVDTPGADSINARHTGVAFNYIKNADAILFVTYYNHAFSQADRQFLMQLGRVKDQFELDKMFFLVNAADLAASEEELNDVLAHVQVNLQQHGIRFPRMFPVSSIRALEAKHKADASMLQQSGLTAFEQSFYQFVNDDLGGLAVQAAEEELKRAISVMEQWMADAKSDEHAKQRAREQLVQAAIKARQQVSELTQTANRQQLHQEISELLFYVLQRVQHRFGEFYTVSFHPSVLQDDGRNMRKALWSCWLNLQRMLQIEFAQEIQATSLRLENALYKFAEMRYVEVATQMTARFADFSYAPMSKLQLPTPQEQPEWRSDDVAEKSMWGHFKSPRHFFEGQGKTQLRHYLENVTAPPMQQWMDGTRQALEIHYEQLWEQAMASAMEQLTSQLESYVEGKHHSLSGQIDLPKLERDVTQLNNLLSTTIEEV